MVDARIVNFIAGKLEKGQRVLYRDAFRWKVNGEVARWAYDDLEMKYVLDLHRNLFVVEKITEDIAIVTGELT